MAMSKLQKYVGAELRKRFSKWGVVENSRPPWLISSKGERLELDFYFEHLMIAIEVQGRQHFHFTPQFHLDEFGFKEQQRRDTEKARVCERAGISLLYVCKKDDLSYILPTICDATAPKSEKGNPDKITQELLEPFRRKAGNRYRKSYIKFEEYLAQLIKVTERMLKKNNPLLTKERYIRLLSGLTYIARFAHEIELKKEENKAVRLAVMLIQEHEKAIYLSGEDDQVNQMCSPMKSPYQKMPLGGGPFFS